jgi:iron complex outermembrane recepter protein
MYSMRQVGEPSPSRINSVISENTMERCCGAAPHLPVARRQKMARNIGIFGPKLFDAVRARRLAIAGLLTLSAGLLANGAWAQDTSGQAQLTEIIVTAQKRSQNLQDVPVSVIALSAEQIQNAGVSDIKNLEILTPALTVTSTTSENSTSVRIRGIGTVSDNIGLESSVGVVIDGVYRPRNGVGFGNLGEIEQIEVLEGPQGELFGKNNDAGVIAVTTKRPSMTFGATGEVTYGNYNDREVSGSVTGPVSEDSAVRLYAEWQKRNGFLNVNDGVGPNTDDTSNNRNAYTVRGQYLITPADAVSFLLIADFSKRNEACCEAVPVIAGPLSPLINILGSTPALGGKTGVTSTPSTNPINPFSYQAYANGVASQQIRDMGISGQLDWDFGDAKLTSITAWRDNTIIAGNDVEYTGAAFAEQPATEANQTDFKQLSEELRLAGKEGPLQWLVGGFFSSEIVTPNLAILAGPQLEYYIGGGATAAGGMAPNPFLVSELTGNAPGGTYVAGETGEADFFRQTDKSFAFFTDETYTIVQGLDLTGGVRYTKEKKNATSNYDDPDGGSACASLLTSPGVGTLNPTTQAILAGFGCATVFNPYFAKVTTAQSLDEDKVTGTVKLAYRFNDDVMTYVSWANGYKAGGFNLARVVDPTATNPFAPNFDTQFPDETVNSYEIGLKSTLAQKTVRLNVSAFDQQYHNFQLNTYNGYEFIVATEPRVTSAGVEVSSDWLTPVRGLSLSGGVTYAFTDTREFGNAIALIATDRVSNRLPYAPLWSGSLSATYQTPITESLALLLTVNEKYNSSYNTDTQLNPVNNQSSYGIVNAKIGVGAPDGKWAVELWGQNLADKGYYQVAFDAPFQVGQTDAFLSDPRTFGVTLRAKF